MRGLFDELPKMSLQQKEASILSHVRQELDALCQRIDAGEPLTADES